MATEMLLTEEEFSRHVNTNFSVAVDESRRVDVKLAEVVGYRAGPDEQQGLERFSLFFDGPADPFLPQGSYPMRHERMGETLIFIVPLGRTPDGGFRYQAVFNYHRR